MPVPVSPPEQLLALASDFIRHNDALTALTLTGPAPAAAVLRHIPTTQHLARAAHTAIDVLKHQPLHHTSAIRTGAVRLKQLAYLATEAADHLIDAMDVLDAIRTGSTDNAGPGLALREGLLGAASRVQLARELTALGPDDAFATAELLGTEMQRQDLAPGHEPTRLSTAQLAALRSVAQGHVSITNWTGRNYVSSRESPLTISTIRALETKDLLHREILPHVADQERVYLTPTGYRALAATFGHSRTSSPASTRAARPMPTTVPSRAR
ncbi:hypothetical protein [Streptomyces klenkii]